MLDPTIGIRRRLGAAIDWRVRDAVAASQPAAGVASKQEVGEVSIELDALRSSVAEIASSISDQLASVTALLEQLDRRVAKLESRPS